MNELVLKISELVRPLGVTDFVNAKVPLIDKMMYIDNIKSNILEDAGYMIRDSIRFLLSGIFTKNPHSVHAVIITSSYQSFSKIVSDNLIKFLNNLDYKGREITSYNQNEPMGVRPRFEKFDYNAKVVPNAFVIYSKGKFRPSISSFIVVECIGTLDEREDIANVLGVVYNSKFVPMGCTVFKDVPLLDV